MSIVDNSQVTPTCWWLLLKLNEIGTEQYWPPIVALCQHMLRKANNLILAQDELDLVKEVIDFK